MLAVAIQNVDTPTVRLVFIDGLGAAGKSVLAEALAGELGAPVVQGDDFYRPSAERQRSGRDPGAIGASFDWRRLERQVLDPLSRGEDTQYRRYDWTDDRLGDWMTVPGAGTVLVEGVYLLRTELRHYASISVWVAAPPEVRLARGIERDGEAARSRWAEDWMPAEDAYVVDMRPEAAATLVVDGQGRGGLDPRRSAVLSEARPPLERLMSAS